MNLFTLYNVLIIYQNQVKGNLFFIIYGDGIKVYVCIIKKQTPALTARQSLLKKNPEFKETLLSINFPSH